MSRMKIVKYLSLLFTFTLVSGCLPLEEETMTLSFWTDRDLSAENYLMVFANETLVGEFENQLLDPSCNDPKLMNFTIDNADDLNLSVRNEIGESIEIGVINLFSVSNGIKIRPTDRGEIFVSQTLDDLCTLVKIDWN